MKGFAWDDAKIAKLSAERGIGFEDIAFPHPARRLARHPRAFDLSLLNIPYMLWPLRLRARD